jgi:hypothetical protein
MIKGLPRSRAALSSAGCPACSSSTLAGAASARTFSTKAARLNPSASATASLPLTRSALSTSSRALARSQSATGSAVRAFGSTSARLADGAPAPAETEEEKAERLAQQELDEMEHLMKQFEEQQLTQDDPPTSLPTEASSTRFPSSSTSPPQPFAGEPSPEPKPATNPFSLLRPSFPSGPPTISDLNSLRPKQFTRPDASSPESLRILYAKSWTAGLNNLNTAFKKSQLIKLVTLPTEQGGLELKYDDPRLKTGIKANKRTKYWKPKKFEMMSKRELSQAIMVLEWGMVDPDTLPKAKVGPSVVESKLLQLMRLACGGREG